jgi:hypothetical protein
MDGEKKSRAMANARRKREHPHSACLNMKQRAFIAAYISNGWNGTRAAISAGYRHPAVVASQLLTKLKVREEIQAALDVQALSAAQVLQRLGEMATANIGDFLDAEGRVDLVKVKSRGHIVKKFRRRSFRDKDGNLAIEDTLELHDAQKALVHIGAHHGLFDGKAEVLPQGAQPFQFVIAMEAGDLP